MISIVAEQWCPRIDESNDRLETGMQRIASSTGFGSERTKADSLSNDDTKKY